MLARWLKLLIITHPPHFIRFVRIAREDPLQNYPNKRQKWCLVVDSSGIIPCVAWHLGTVRIMKLICTLFTKHRDQGGEGDQQQHIPMSGQWRLWR